MPAVSPLGTQPRLASGPGAIPFLNFLKKSHTMKQKQVIVRETNKPMQTRALEWDCAWSHEGNIILCGFPSFTLKMGDSLFIYLFISPSCDIMCYLGLWGLTLNLRLFFLFFWGSQILDGFSSLMVSSFFLDLLKKTLHILKIHIRLYFPFLKKWVSRLVFNSTGIYLCIWPVVEI